MSIYPPPNYTQPLSIFNPANYGEDGITITKSYLDANYLKYPVAQPGTETLNDVIINGSADLNSSLIVSGTSNFENTITLSSPTANDRRVSSSYYDLTDINGNVNRTSRMYQDGINLLISNDTTSGKIRFSCEDTGGNPINIMEMENFIGTTCYRPLVILANNNLQMNAGTGRINQSGTTNDTSTTNNLKKTVISYSNSGNTSAIPALEIYENAGRGAYFVPNTQAGNYGPNVAVNDFAIVTRHFMMPTAAICITNDTALRNHLRLSVSTDGSLCSAILQNGATDIANASEFRMDYNFNATPQNTISFNNPINFNPTNNGAINSNRRRLNGLGTLSFTDISGNNTTTGSTTSAIWTDSSLVSSLNGMYYDCGINGGFHQFSTRDASGSVTTPIYYGSNLTSVSNTFVVRNSTITSNRFDIVGDTSQNTFIRGRSTTASTEAHIHINCDSVNAGGTTTNNSVMNITPFHINYRRPIQFNYLTTPSGFSQLGYSQGYSITSASFASSATIRNSATYSFTSAGTYLINWKPYAQMASGTATFSLFRFGIANTGTATFDTDTLTYTSYMDLKVAYPTLTVNDNLNEPTSCVYVATTSSVAYFNFLANYTGGTNINISGYYTITRIG